MTTDQWRRIKAIVYEASMRDPAVRRTFVEDACAGDREVLGEVASLLESLEQVGDRFDALSFDLQSPGPSLQSLVAGSGFDPDSSDLIGRRLGPYRIERELGRGGMGAVYLASRADREFTHEVALKIIKRGMDTDAIVRRFRTERQILADLEHPYIARLLDGGTTTDGLPYLVMEYVNGQPLTTYCDEHRLTIAERLAMFRKICEAVAYAHQRLVVHRDIKPSNVLVSSDGVPKLLDFGLAKILDPDTPETETVHRWLTPVFASPEQLRGDRITTVSDVYSLGLLLYELLSGTRPFSHLETGGVELLRAVLEEEPEKPSVAAARASDTICASRQTKRDRLRRTLRGDLDNIVLKALDKDPARRYAAAQDLSEDIRRYLARLPVSARRDTFVYHTTKFVRRHTGAAIATAAIAVTLLAATGITMAEARVARANQRRAERRFNDVRALANSLLFEIHDGIRDLPGSTRVRELLVKNALGYLDSLSTEAAGDVSLQRELAAAYDRVGSLQHSNDYANQGDTAGALRSYRKALALRESLAATDLHDSARQLELADEYFKIADTTEATGDFSGALDLLQKIDPVTDRLKAGTGDSRILDRQAGSHYYSGRILMEMGDAAAALEHYRRAVAIHESAHPTDPGDVLTLRTHLAGDYSGMAEAMMEAHQLDAAIPVQERVVNILEQLSASNPNSSSLDHFLGNSYALLATMWEKQGDQRKALEYRRRGYGIAERIATSDPQDSLARKNLAFAASDLGESLVASGNVTEGLPHIREGLAMFEAMAGTSEKDRYVSSGLAGSYYALGLAFSALAAEADLSLAQRKNNWTQARSWFQKSAELFAGIRSTGALDYDARDKAERVSQGLARCDAALTRLANSSRADR